MAIHVNGKRSKKDALRICILTTSFPVGDGVVAGPFVYGQAANLVNCGVRVDVVAPHCPGSAREETREGIQVHRVRYVIPERFQTLCYGAGIPTNLRRSWWARLQLPFLVTAFFLAGLRHARGSDVIHANWAIAGFAGILLGKILRKPVVLVMYGAEIFVLGHNPLLKFILRQADHVIAISQYTLDKTLEVQRPQVYSLIPPGLDVRRFQPAADTTAVQSRLAAQGVDFSHPLVMALGNFIERKGFSYVIAAIAHLQADYPVQLMMGGRGPLKEALQRQAADLGIADKVFFLDYIPDEEMPAYYTLADVFVSPSVVDSQGDTEGLGMVLLEANACETPCVASATGGIVDIIVDGVNGYLARPADADDLAAQIKRLLDDPEQRRRMGQQGRQRVIDHFAWEIKARQILAVYEEVLA